MYHVLSIRVSLTGIADVSVSAIAQSTLLPETSLASIHPSCMVPRLCCQGSTRGVLHHWCCMNHAAANPPTEPRKAARPASVCKTFMPLKSKLASVYFRLSRTCKLAGDIVRGKPSLRPKKSRDLAGCGGSRRLFDSGAHPARGPQIHVYMACSGCMRMHAMPQNRSCRLESHPSPFRSSTHSARSAELLYPSADFQYSCAQTNGPGSSLEMWQTAGSDAVSLQGTCG